MCRSRHLAPRPERRSATAQYGGAPQRRWTGSSVPVICWTTGRSARQVCCMVFPTESTSVRLGEISERKQKEKQLRKRAALVQKQQPPVNIGSKRWRLAAYRSQERTYRFPAIKDRWKDHRLHGIRAHRRGCAPLRNVSKLLGNSSSALTTDQAKVMQGCTLHGLRHAVLQQQLPGQQHHSGLPTTPCVPG